MFAIVTIAGQQFKVEEGQELFVHQLDAKEGDNVSFDQVHLIDRDGSVNLGKLVFKKKRRKGYKKKNGHRQSFTKLKIDSIAG